MNMKTKNNIFILEIYISETDFSIRFQFVSKLKCESIYLKTEIRVISFSKVK